jgi:hypothetical protein
MQLAIRTEKQVVEKQKRVARLMRLFAEAARRTQTSIPLYASVAKICTFGAVEPCGNALFCQVKPSSKQTGKGMFSGTSSRAFARMEPYSNTR